MDWDAMIADLESSFDAERRADLVAQSAELAEAEQASISVVDRLQGSVGRRIHLRTRSGVPVDGVVCRVEPSYVLVDGRRRPTLTALMREVARRGARVRLVVGSGEVVGRLVRIGADHVDVAVDPEGGVRSHRAPGAGGAGVISVMTAAIEVLRSR